MAITRGTKASGGTDFVSGFTILADEMNTDLNTAFSGVNNVTIADANVTAGANIDPSKIGDFSATDPEYQTTAAPAARADGTDYTIITTSKPTDLEGEIARFRYLFLQAFGNVIGTTGNLAADQWYSMFGKGTMMATGFMLPTLLAAAPTGWILADDGSIGDATSGATTRADKDTRELYNLLWNKYVDGICPVTGGRGANSTADFDAHKPLFLPPFCGRVLGVAGTAGTSVNFMDSLSGTNGTIGTTPKVGTSSSVFFIHYALSSATDNIYNGYKIRFTSGALSGTEQTISAYDGNLHQVTVGSAFGGTPAAGVSYVIYPADNSHLLLPYNTSPAGNASLNGYTLVLTAGTGGGQTKNIVGYTSDARLLTISGTFSPNPDHTTQYAIKTKPTIRAVGALSGAELHFPMLDTMATHRHSSAMDSQGSGNSHTVMTSIPGSTGDNDTSTDGALVAMGNGTSISNMQPTFFCNWIVKL